MRRIIPPLVHTVENGASDNAEVTIYNDGWCNQEMCRVLTPIVLH